MSPRELRAQLRARRKAARVALAEAKARARASAGELPAVRRARRAKRLRRAATAAVVLALLLLIHCECGPAAPPEPVLAAAVKPPPPPEKKPVVPVRPPGKLKATLEPQPRPSFKGQGVATPAWVDEFRLQVSARSPRLAKCFVGVDRPGALRWVSSVNPTSGTVSDHEFEPVGLASDLSPPQRECVIAVLSSPVYRLSETAPDALPNRVSLVIEF